MCVAEIVCYMKMNIGGLEKNSVMHDYNTCHRSALQLQFCRTVILKKVSNMGIKLHNNLPNHLKNLDNIQLFREKLKLLYCNTPIPNGNIFHMNVYHRKCKCM